jgi:hypothetical protein
VKIRKKEEKRPIEQKRVKETKVKYLLSSNSLGTQA